MKADGRNCTKVAEYAQQYGRDENRRFVYRDGMPTRGCGNTDSVSIERVLKADKATNKGVTSVAQIVTNMRAIELAGYPNDFRAAYLAHIHAWEALASVEQEVRVFQDEYNSALGMAESFIQGFLGGLTLGAIDPFGKAKEGTAAQSDLRQHYKAAAEQIRDTYNRVEESAVGHGAKLPAKSAAGAGA